MINKKICDDFFPDYLPRNITKQEELEMIILKNPKLSKSFVWLAVCQPEMREVYEKEWENVKKFLDKDFLSIIQTKEDAFASRSWEFHLAVALLKNGLNLKEKISRSGPDFCIETNYKRKIWIEAITCTLGNEDPVEPPPNLVSGQIYTREGNIEDSHRPRALRITSAIWTKLVKYRKYLKNGVVSKSDCLIIAVNGQAIAHFSDPTMLFKYAIFGQGPDILVKVPGKDKLQGGFYKPIPMIIKNAKGKTEEIPPHFMEMEDFSIISAVIYCGYGLSAGKYNGWNIGDDFLFAYHSNPINKIPKNQFKFGRGIRKNLKKSQIIDLNQKTNGN